MTYNKGSNMNSSGIKYFIVQSIASITMLTSITSLMIYDSPYVTFIMSLTAISILMKMGVAPFFVSTGFHGIHVIIGTTFLLTCLAGQLSNHFSSKHHLGFEAAEWYWHFVAVVWLFLYISIYWWGN